MQRDFYKDLLKYERLDAIFNDYISAKPEAKCYWWNGEWRTRAEFKNLADKCTEFLKNSGFTKGQRLVSLMPNNPMTLAVILSVWRLGGVFCPLNEKAGKLSLLKTLDLLKPFAVIASEGVKKELTDALTENNWPFAVCPDEKIPSDFKGRVQESESEDLAVIFSTSGTTGDPKAVPLTHSNLIDNCIACLEWIEDLQPDDIFLTVLPNFHAFGFTVSMILPFLTNACEVLVPGFMPPQNTLKAILSANANILLLVPTMVNFLTGLLERNGQKLENIKLLIAGGDKYNPKLDDRVKSAFGVGVLEGYGITECSPVLAVNKTYEVRRLGTVGQALPRFEIQLRDESGNILDENANEGVLWTKGPSVTSGYYHAPEINKERFHDGWFNTGDYVKIDEDGYIKILDRVTDIIIVGGFNVYPQEVEAILAENPAVQTAVVTGTPNNISGEVPKAFIIKNKGCNDVTETDLIRFCKERLSHYKVPRAIEFVEALPLSATGKILRRVLREQEREKAKK